MPDLAVTTTTTTTNALIAVVVGAWNIGYAEQLHPPTRG